MEKIQKVSVFATFKTLLHVLTIYNWKNFRKQERDILIRNIGHAIGVALLLLNFAVAAYADFSYCLKYKFDLKIVALPVAIFIAAPQIILSYVAITIKNDLVYEVVNSLNGIINKRE